MDALKNEAVLSYALRADDVDRSFAVSVHTRGIVAALQRVLDGRAPLGEFEEALASRCDYSDHSGDSLPDGTLLLCAAARAGNFQACKLLLQSRVDASAQDSSKIAPLHCAAFSGSTELAQLLFRARADANAVDAAGQTPLYFAPSRAMCETLVTSRADVNMLNNAGQSALHLAAQAGMVETLAWLASVMSPRLLNLVDAAGWTTADYANRSRSRAAVRLLRLQGAQVAKEVLRSKRCIQNVAPPAARKPERRFVRRQGACGPSARKDAKSEGSQAAFEVWKAWKRVMGCRLPDSSLCAIVPASVLQNAGNSQTCDGPKKVSLQALTTFDGASKSLDAVRLPLEVFDGGDSQETSANRARQNMMPLAEDGLRLDAVLSDGDSYGNDQRHDYEQDDENMMAPSLCLQQIAEQSDEASSPNISLSMGSRHIADKSEEAAFDPNMSLSIGSQWSDLEDMNTAMAREVGKDSNPDMEMLASKQEVEDDWSMFSIRFPDAPWPPPEKFKEELLRNLEDLGVPEVRTFSLSFMPGSIVAVFRAPQASLSELTQAPINSLEVLGYRTEAATRPVARASLPAIPVVPKPIDIDELEDTRAFSKKPETMTRSSDMMNVDSLEGDTEDVSSSLAQTAPIEKPKVLVAPSPILQLVARELSSKIVDHVVDDIANEAMFSFSARSMARGSLVELHASSCHEDSPAHARRGSIRNAARGSLVELHAPLCHEGGQADAPRGSLLGDRAFTTGEGRLSVGISTEHAPSDDQATQTHIDLAVHSTQTEIDFAVRSTQTENDFESCAMRDIPVEAQTMQTDSQMQCMQGEMDFEMQPKQAEAAVEMRATETQTEIHVESHEVQTDFETSKRDGNSLRYWTLRHTEGGEIVMLTCATQTEASTDIESAPIQRESASDMQITQTQVSTQTCEPQTVLLEPKKEVRAQIEDLLAESPMPMVSAESPMPMERIETPKKTNVAEESDEAAECESVEAAEPDYRNDRNEECNVEVQISPFVGLADCVMWEVVLEQQAVQEDSNNRFLGGFGFRVCLQAYEDPSSLEGANLEQVPVDEAPLVLVVSEILPQGALVQWNMEHPESEVRQGDLIVEVNGMSDIQRMQEELKSSAVWLQVRRFVPPFSIRLERQAFGDWGFIFRASSPDGNELLVEEVLTDGVLALHNFQQAASGHWDYMVVPKMRIVAVNDVAGDGQQMIEILQKSDQVKLQILRARHPHLESQSDRMQLMNDSSSSRARSNAGSSQRVESRSSPSRAESRGSASRCESRATASRCESRASRSHLVPTSPSPLASLPSMPLSEAPETTTSTGQPQKDLCPQATVVPPQWIEVRNACSSYEINGIYDLQAETYYDMPMWQAQANHDIWFLKFPGKGWYVTSSERKRSGEFGGWAGSHGEATLPTTATSWKTWNGEKWESSKMSISVLQAPIELHKTTISYDNQTTWKEDLQRWWRSLMESFGVADKAEFKSKYPYHRQRTYDKNGDAVQLLDVDNLSEERFPVTFELRLPTKSKATQQEAEVDEQEKVAQQAAEDASKRAAEVRLKPKRSRSREDEELERKAADEAEAKEKVAREEALRQEAERDKQRRSEEVAQKAAEEEAVKQAAEEAARQEAEKDAEQRVAEEDLAGKMSQEELPPNNTEATPVEKKEELQIGDRVEVYSHSKQQWCPGVITKVWPERPEPTVTVEYSDGRDTMSKEMATNHLNLRLVSSQNHQDNGDTNEE